MRRLSLYIAAISSALAAIACIVYAVITAAAGNVLNGIIFLGIGTPVCIGLAVVFDYVSERLRLEQFEKHRGKQDVVDTPWQDDPDHV